MYGLIISIFLMIKKRKEFSKKFQTMYIKTKKIRNTLLLLAGILVLFNLLTSNPQPIKYLIYFSAIFPLLFFYLLISIKSIESISMEKTILTSKLVEGDWINEEVKINGKLIYSPKSLGVNKEQIELIRKHKKNIKVKEGIAFIPSFLIGTIISLIFGNIIILT